MATLERGRPLLKQFGGARPGRGDPKFVHKRQQGEVRRPTVAGQPRDSWRQKNHRPGTLDRGGGTGKTPAMKEPVAALVPARLKTNEKNKNLEPPQ